MESMAGLGYKDKEFCQKIAISAQTQESDLHLEKELHKFHRQENAKRFIQIELNRNVCSWIA